MSITLRGKFEVFHFAVKLPLNMWGSVTYDIFEEKSRDLALLEVKRSSVQGLVKFLISFKLFRKLGVNSFH